jgi:hypothetical protein
VSKVEMERLEAPQVSSEQMALVVRAPHNDSKIGSDSSCDSERFVVL